MIPWAEEAAVVSATESTQPDRIFAASGRGVTGAITEFRHGIQAHIGLDLAYEFPVRQSWIFPAHLADAAQGFHLLLSLPSTSELLHLSKDYSEVEGVDPDTLQYDLASRTVQATQVSDGMIVQITETNIVLITATQRCALLISYLPPLFSNTPFFQSASTCLPPSLTSYHSAATSPTSVSNLP